MLIGPTEQRSDYLLVRYLCVREWEINPTKIQRASTSVKFLEVQWCGRCRAITSKIKDKVLHLITPTTEIQAR